MTTALEPAVSSLVGAIEEIGDPIERYEAVKDLEVRLDDEFKRLKAQVAQELHEDRSWKQVGELLGVTGSRAEQISRGAR